MPFLPLRPVPLSPAAATLYEEWLAAAISPIDQWSCQSSLTVQRAQEPAAMDVVLSCVEAAEDCPGVLACIPDATP